MRTSHATGNATARAGECSAQLVSHLRTHWVACDYAQIGTQLLIPDQPVYAVGRDDLQRVRARSKAICLQVDVLTE